MKTAHRIASHHKRALRADPTAAFAALARVQPLEDVQRNDLGLAYWSAWTALREGRGNEHDANTLAVALNIGLVLAERSGSAELGVPIFQRAQDALVMLGIESQRRGWLWRINANAAERIPEALELHDQQMQACTGAQILAAMGEVRRRVDRGDVVQVEAA